VFNSGVFTTNYLPETYPEGFQGIRLTPTDVTSLTSLAAVMHCKEQERARVRLTDTKVKAVRAPRPVEVVVGVKGEEVGVQVTKGEGSYTVTGPHGVLKVEDNFTLADPVVEAMVGEERVVAQLIRRDASGGLRIRYKGTALEVSVLPSSAAALRHIMPVKVPVDTSRIILSPMPGVVKSVTVAVGDMVGEGQECAVVEAMKMQNSLSSGVTGVVTKVLVQAGDTVDEDQVLVEIE